MNQKTINQEANKIIDAIRSVGEDCVKQKVIVLDLKKGFLFYNYAKKLIYTGMAIVSPTHLSGEIRRSSEVKNYIIGRNKNDYIMHNDCSLDELKDIYDQIISCV